MTIIFVWGMVILFSMYNVQASITDRVDCAQQRAKLRLQQQKKLAIDLTERGQAFIVSNQLILAQSGQTPIKEIQKKLAKNHELYTQEVQKLQDLHRQNYEVAIETRSKSSKVVLLPNIKKKSVNAKK